MQAEPVVLILREVDEEHRTIAEVVDDGFEAPVVEQISDGQASA